MHIIYKWFIYNLYIIYISFIINLYIIYKSFIGEEKEEEKGLIEVEGEIEKIEKIEMIEVIEVIEEEIGEEIEIEIEEIGMSKLIIIYKNDIIIEKLLWLI